MSVFLNGALVEVEKFVDYINLFGHEFDRETVSDCWETGVAVSGDKRKFQQISFVISIANIERWSTRSIYRRLHRKKNERQYAEGER